MEGGFPFMTRGIDTHQRKVVAMFVKLTGATVAGGTLTINGLDTGAAQHLKVTENSSGSYTFTLNNPGQRFVGIQATSITAGKLCTASIGTDGQTCTVLQTTASTAVAFADGDLFATLFVSHAADAT